MAVPQVEPINLQALQSQCNQRAISASELSEFKATGAGQGIEEIYIGEGRAMAKLALAADLLETEGQFILHPAVLETALIVPGFMPQGLQDLKEASRPYTLQEAEILDRSTTPAWVYVESSDSGTGYNSN